MNLQQALAALDPENDAHWTKDGLPVVELVNSALPDDAKVTRKEITAAYPNFNRESWRADKAEQAAAAEAKASEDGAGDAGSDPAADAEADADPQVERDEFGHPVKRKAAAVTDEVVEQIEEAPLRERVEAIREELGDIDYERDEIARAKDAIAKRTVELDARARALEETLERILPSSSNQEGIAAYLKRQHETRMDRVTSTRRVLAGINLADLDPRSRLDQAMARKTQRGTERPNRAPTK